MQPTGTLKKIKTCEMGAYFRLDSGKVIFISHQDMLFDFHIKFLRSKFEDNWPELWKFIRLSIPEGPFPFRESPRTREGALMEDPGDFYWLTKADLLRVGNLQDASADKILKAIGKSKDRPLGKIIFALGIVDVGREWSDKLANKFQSIDNLGRATWGELILIPGLGATIASSILEWFHTEGNWKTVEKMRLAGVVLSEPTTLSNLPEYYQAVKDWIRENDENLSALRYDTFQTWLDSMKEDLPVSAEEVPVPVSPIRGKTFMFTGRLETMTRPVAQSKVEELGGIAGSSVTSNTDYLVVGENPGSKLGHAMALGITKLTEEEFLSMLEA